MEKTDSNRFVRQNSKNSLRQNQSYNFRLGAVHNCRQILIANWVCMPSPIGFLSCILSHSFSASSALFQFCSNMLQITKSDPENIYNYFAKPVPPVFRHKWWDAGMVICLERGANLHMAQLMLLPLTVSCFSKIQIGFTFLVPAHQGSPGKRVVCQTTALHFLLPCMVKKIQLQCCNFSDPYM